MAGLFFILRNAEGGGMNQKNAGLTLSENRNMSARSGQSY